MVIYDRYVYGQVRQFDCTSLRFQHLKDVDVNLASLYGVLRTSPGYNIGDAQRENHIVSHPAMSSMRPAGDQTA